MKGFDSLVVREMRVVAPMFASLAEFLKQAIQLAFKKEVKVYAHYRDDVYVIDPDEYVTYVVTRTHKEKESA